MRSRFFPEAEQDISRIVAYVKQYNPAAAERFVLAANATAASLCDMPGMGTFVEQRPPALHGLRRVGVKKFKSYVMYYLTTDQTIDVVRVMHTAQDRDRIIGNMS